MPAIAEPPLATLDGVRLAWLKEMAAVLNVDLNAGVGLEGAPSFIPGSILQAKTAPVGAPVGTTPPAPPLALPPAVKSSLKTSAAEDQAFQDDMRQLPAAARQTAVNVLTVLYKTPQPPDYVKQLGTLMATLPADQGMAVGKALNKLGVYLPNLKPDSPGAEDASARIKKIYMAGYSGGPQSDYVRDIIAQAKQEGFKVVLQIKKGTDVADLKNEIAADMAGTIANVKELEKYIEILEADKEGYVWAEDNKWLSSDGNTIRTTPNISSDTHRKLKQFTTALSLKPNEPGYAEEGHHTAGKKKSDPTSTSHPGGLVNEFSAQGAVDGRKEHLSAKALGDATGKHVDTTRTYNEGGNMLVGTMPSGQPYAVVGRDGLLLSYFHLQEEFDKNATNVPEFDPANVKARMAKLTFDKTEVAQAIERLEAIDASLGSKSDAKKQETAKEFLTKLDLVKDIFATDTAVPRDQLIFVPQPDFHIDMHMRPLAPGQIMVNDFGANIALLDDAMTRATPGSWEAKQLQSMRDHAAQMQKVMGPVMDEIVRQSEKGGLKVVRAPGVMEGEFDGVTVAKSDDIGKFLGLTADRTFTRKELGDALYAKYGGSPTKSQRANISETLDEMFTRHVNFMNAIPATKDGTNQQFYMTNYSSIKPLRDTYEAYLKGKGIEQVKWIGDDGGGRLARSASEDSLQLSGGLDCRENH